MVAVGPAGGQRAPSAGRPSLREGRVDEAGRGRAVHEGPKAPARRPRVDQRNGLSLPMPIVIAPPATPLIDDAPLREHCRATDQGCPGYVDVDGCIRGMPAQMTGVDEGAGSHAH